MSGKVSIVIGHDLDASSADFLEADEVSLFPESESHPRGHGRIFDVAIDRAKNLDHHAAIVTHSECIVLRARRRRVEGLASLGDVKLYFVGGALGPREIVIDDMGGIDWWPSGFFEEALQEVRAIHRAQMERKR